MLRECELPLPARRWEEHVQDCPCAKTESGIANTEFNETDSSGWKEHQAEGEEGNRSKPYRLPRMLLVSS